MLLLFFVLFFSREKILECIQKYAILKIIWIYMYVCIYIYIYIYIYMCVCVCVCVYIYIYIHWEYTYKCEICKCIRIICVGLAGFN